MQIAGQPKKAQQWPWEVPLDGFLRGFFLVLRNPKPGRHKMFNWNRQDKKDIGF
jgi:hypothetical protein